MAFLDLIFPKTCLECGREGEYLCPDCMSKTKPARLICPYCYKPAIDGTTHTRCSKKLGLDGLTSIWEYEGIVRKAVLSLKYKYATELEKELQVYIVSELKRKLFPSDAFLVPIPIHWHKENVRGFNQSILVGKNIASKMGWRFLPDLLIKKVSTVSQAELSSEKRRKNLKGVFVVSTRNSPFIIPDSVILFDDVFTTGSTMREAAIVLKRAGVEKVWGLTIAR